MNIQHRRRASSRGFTLIEILTVLAIIGILTAVLIPAVGAAQRRSRMTATLSEIRSLKAIVADAVNQFGGSLPLTEGLITTNLIPARADAAILTVEVASQILRLDQVLLGLTPPLLERPWSSRFGNGVAPLDFVQPQIIYDGKKRRFDREVVGGDTRRYTYNLNDANAADDGTNYSRLECARIVERNHFDLSVPARSNVNTAGGINFDLDGNGVIGEEASFAAYIVYRRVPVSEAYQLALSLNGQNLMNDAAPGGNAVQMSGPVIYGTPAAGVVDVYVCLGLF